MKIYILLKDHKTRYCYDGSTDLEIQCQVYQIAMGFVAETDRTIPKFTWKGEGPRMAKTTLKGAKKVGVTSIIQFPGLLKMPQ